MPRRKPQRKLERRNTIVTVCINPTILGKYNGALASSPRETWNCLLVRKRES